MFNSHQEFIKYWNYERQHQGIGYLYPADIYFRDLKKGPHVGGWNMSRETGKRINVQGFS
jgi:hypothetical protein